MAARINHMFFFITIVCIASMVVTPGTSSFDHPPLQDCETSKFCPNNVQACFKSCSDKGIPRANCNGNLCCCGI
ncbi:LCR-like protein [Medicago truncatula]|uniref:LCR-like protein n=1 Tax=Medicago truncatula TaxID=3880 RepID=A0A072V9U6_MEDTR|nr:LCR-like protein [Medicago truncatula]